MGYLDFGRFAAVRETLVSACSSGKAAEDAIILVAARLASTGEDVDEGIAYALEWLETEQAKTQIPETARKELVKLLAIRISTPPNDWYWENCGDAEEDEDPIEEEEPLN